MPVVSLTDMSIRQLKPVAGKQVTYTGRSLKGFGGRVSTHGAMTPVVGANRMERLARPAKPDRAS